jgi:hypothetical protein
MKTVKLPMLKADLPTDVARDTMIAHHVRGGVVKRGASYDFVSLDDVLKGLDSKTTRPFPKIKRSKLDLNAVTSLESDPLWARVKIGAHVQFAAPLYVCPKGDYSQSTSGACPAHHVPLVRIKDTG